MRQFYMCCLCLGVSFFAQSQLPYTATALLSTMELGVIETSINKKDLNLIPFELLGGLIMVDTKIDGKHASCVLDTGAPSIFINKNQEDIGTSDFIAVGVTGSMPVKSKPIKKFEMGNILRNNLDGVEIDISHLEKLKSDTIDGIIGVDPYKEEEILIDYQNKYLQVLPRKHQKVMEDKRIIASVPFIMQDQLPIIKVKIGKKTFRFGVDTGAEVNVFNCKKGKKLAKSLVKSGDPQSIVSIMKENRLASSIIIPSFKIKKQKITETEFVCFDLSGFIQSHGIEIDGILGYPFLQDHLISFDFKSKRIYFWERIEGKPKEKRLLFFNFIN